MGVINQNWFILLNKFSSLNQNKLILNKNESLKNDFYAFAKNVNFFKKNVSKNNTSVFDLYLNFKLGYFSIFYNNLVIFDLSSFKLDKVGKKLFVNFFKNFKNFRSNFYLKSFVKSESISNLTLNFFSTFEEKNLNKNNLNFNTAMLLRKTKIFNKGRYSRNRQIYRTGVYLCLWINIIAIVVIYFLFYRFLFNFGYLWWLFFIGLSLFFFSRFFKYDFFNINTLYFNFNFFLNWLNTLFLNFFKNLKKSVIYLQKITKIFLIK